MISKCKFYLMWIIAIVVLITIGIYKENNTEKAEKDAIILTIEKAFDDKNPLELKLNVQRFYAMWSEPELNLKTEYIKLLQLKYPGITENSLMYKKNLAIALLNNKQVKEITDIPNNKTEYMFSHVSYEELNSEIGCDSKYSKAKKKDIFNSRYKNHWMVWGGEVILPDADRVSLNCDGKGIQDLVVTFANKNAGYDLMEGNHISVRFLMKHAGGCILPFSGEKATIRR